MNYRLYIEHNGTYKELVGINDAGLILEVNNPLEYEFGKSSKTYSITIPNIGENNILLDNIFNKTYGYGVVYDNVFLNIFDNINLKGVLKVNEFNHTFLSAQFISEYSVLLDLLKNTELNQLDYEMPYTLNKDNIVLSQNLGLYDGNIVFDLIDRGKTRTHEESEFITEGTSIKVYDRGVDVSEHFPMVKVKPILEKIFEGYTLEGNFFDNQFYDIQYLAFTFQTKNITNDNNYVLRHQVTAGLEFNRGETFDYLIGSAGNHLFNNTIYPKLDIVNHNISGAYDMNNNEIVIKESGVYNIRVRLTGRAEVRGIPNGSRNSVVFPSSPTGTITAYIFDGGPQAYLYSNSRPQTFVFTPTRGQAAGVLPTDKVDEGDFTISVSSGDVYFEAGQVFKFSINFSGQANVGGGGNFVLDTLIDKSKSVFELIPSTGFGDGSVIEVQDFMPNTKISEFLKWYLREFNIEVYINQEQKKVIFYNAPANMPMVDITENIVEDSLLIKPDSDRSNYLFRRKIDSKDGIMKTQYPINPEINRDYLLDTGGRNTIIFESDFSTTVEQTIPRWGIMENSPVMWKELIFTPDKGLVIPNLETDFNWRLLYDTGLHACDYDLHFGEIQDHSIPGYPISPIRTYEYRKFSTAIPYVNKDSYFFDSNPDGDLFEIFHYRTTYNKLYGHILECEVLLDNNFIHDLYYLTDNKDWRQIFYIDIPTYQGTYRLIKLDLIKENHYKATFYKDLLVIPKTKPTADVITIKPDCGDADGSIQFTGATGGVPPYEYSIDGTTWQSDPNFTGLTEGFYLAAVRDSEGTSKVLFEEFYLGYPPVDGTVTWVNPSCGGDVLGSITVVNAVGGTGAFEYFVAEFDEGGYESGWQASNTFPDLPEGTYNVYIRDANQPNCMKVLIEELVLESLSQVSAGAWYSNISCFGAENGVIGFGRMTGGSGVYEYSVDNGVTWQLEQKFENLPADLYFPAIRDTFNPSCITYLGYISITEPEILNADMTISDPSYAGANDGQIILTNATGGSGQYEFRIVPYMTGVPSAWQTSGLFDDLPDDRYFVWMRDKLTKSCSRLISGEKGIVDPDCDVTGTVTVFNVSCYTGADGSIEITNLTGGSGNYETQLNEAGWISGTTYTGLTAGVYQIDIRDANVITCVTTLNRLITQPDILNATVMSTDLTFTGANDGTIIISSPTGGSGEYEYSIDGGVTWQLSGSFTGLSPDTYDVRIRDKNATSCIITLDGALVVIDSDCLLSATVESTPVTNSGDSDGVITISSPTGGSGFYEYSINGGTTWGASGSFTGLTEGTYDVRIRDTNDILCIIILNSDLVITNVKYNPIIAAGLSHTLYYEENGDGQVWAWGYNNLGQLGINVTLVNKCSPVSIHGAKKTFCNISAGSHFSLGVDYTGQVWSWGVNQTAGQLGINVGSLVCRCTPVSIHGTKKTFCSISAGAAHSLGIDYKGQVWAWGSSWVDGRLGDTSTTSRLTPVSIHGTKKTFCSIAGGGTHSLGLDIRGQAWGWGNNFYGQLGVNDTTCRCTPVSILGAKKTFCSISGGLNYSIGIDYKGQVWGWGLNGNSQLGDNSSTSRRTPVSIHGTKKTFCHITAGQRHTLGIDYNGQLWAWGSPTHGALGNNTTSGGPFNTPVSVHGTKKTFCHITAGSDISFGVDHVGNIWSWGNNSYGQLGDNSVTYKCTPVRVCNF